MANLLAVLPHGRVAAGRYSGESTSPVALGKLSGVFDQSPGPNVVAGVGGRPVVEDHLVKDEATLFVVKVVELDEVNRFPGNVVLRRDAEGDSGSANGDSKGTHQSPPCCR